MVSSGTLSSAATSSVVKGRSDSALAASPDSGTSTGATSVGGQSDLRQDHRFAMAQSSTYRSLRPMHSRNDADDPVAFHENTALGARSPRPGKPPAPDVPRHADWQPLGWQTPDEVKAGEGARRWRLSMERPGRVSLLGV